MNKIPPTIIIIIGISGDLSRRKLLPALGQIAAVHELPEEYRIVGITRQKNLSADDLLAKTAAGSEIGKHLELWEMDLGNTDDYRELDKHLQEIEKNFSEPAQRLFYLSVPPQISRPIIEHLGLSGLSQVKNTKLLVEKPFGVDLANAEELIEHINRFFTVEQIYRVDHYLAKEAVQNIVVFRQDNALFRKTWNNNFIEKIEIIASETIGIEGRAVFYEQTGALRDFVQSHLLQLAALVLMDIPDGWEYANISDLRLQALQKLHLPKDEPIGKNVVRGQYSGYREETGRIETAVETFVSLNLKSDDPRWQGVPIILTTGKSLDKKFTGIKITYKKDESYEADKLIIRLQPDEGAELSILAKKPGYDYQVERHHLNFSFHDSYPSLPEAYEQVLFNVMNSDHNLFASDKEVLETWRIVDAIQKSWEMSPQDLVFYQPGDSIDEILALGE
jgi:glucose-6-phosphate 1-dehydrogenase